MRTVIRLLAIAALTYTALLLVVFLARNRLIFPVRGGGAGDPARAGMPDGQVVTIETADGERLSAWYLPPRDSSLPAAAMLWFHGNAEPIAALGYVIRELRPERAALLVVDYRGYGASTGSTTAAGTLLDAEASWAWLTARAEVDSSRIVVYGRSIGSGPAAWLAANRPVAGLLLESPLTSLRAMARAAFPIFPSFIAGTAYDNLAAVRRSTCPVLVIHGEHDGTIPTSMGRELAAAAGDRATLWIVPGAGHNDVFDVGGERYVATVRGFVEGL